jgi:hypothetical protein
MSGVNNGRGNRVNEREERWASARVARLREIARAWIESCCGVKGILPSPWSDIMSPEALSTRVRAARQKFERHRERWHTKISRRVNGGRLSLALRRDARQQCDCSLRS